MDHNTCRENLSAYLDGELPALEKALLEAHLADCPDCRAELGQLGSVSAIFKKHAMEPVPPALKGAVLGGRKAARPWLKPVLALSAAAAGVLVVINLNRSPEGSLSLDTGGFGSKSINAYEALPAGEGGQALPAEVAAAPAAPAAGLPAESGKRSVSRVAAVRGSYAQAKFAAPRSMGVLSGGAAGANLGMAASGPQAAAEFAGPVCVRVFTPASLNEADAGMAQALAFLKKTGARVAQAEPGRLVFVKNDGARLTLTEKDCAYGLIFFDGVQDPLVVTDFGAIAVKYRTYFGSSPAR